MTWENFFYLVVTCTSKYFTGKVIYSGSLFSYLYFTLVHYFNILYFTLTVLPTGKNLGKTCTKIYLLWFIHGSPLGPFVSWLNTSFVSRIEVSFPESKLTFRNEIFVSKSLLQFRINRGFLFGIKALFPTCYSWNSMLRFLLVNTGQIRSLVSRIEASIGKKILSSQK